MDAHVCLLIQDEIDINEFLECFRVTAKFNKDTQNQKRWSRVRSKLRVFNALTGPNALDSLATHVEEEEGADRTG